MRAIILAGGESSRMEQDKALLKINGQPLLQYQLDMLIEAKISTVVVSNENKLLNLPASYRNHVCVHWCQDVSISKAGPLSGLLAGLNFFKAASQDAVIVVACDVFGLPAYVFEALNEKRLNSGVEIACLSVSNRLQPLVAVLDTNLRSSLQAYFHQGGRSVMKWYKQHGVACLDETELQALNLPLGQYATNLNCKEDVEQLLQRLSDG